MRPSFLWSWSLVLILFAPAKSLAGGTSGTLPSITAQPSAIDNLHTGASQASDSATMHSPARQRRGSTTLELAPQPSGKVPAPDSDKNDNARAFEKSQELAEIARLNKNFHPRDLEPHNHRPYLGLELEYSTQCFAGAEEHGFEVVNVYPGSPAERAGMIGRKSSTPSGDLAALGSVLFLPIAPITMPMLRHSGALGTPGDLIVAVDDRRVRTKAELLYMLGSVKQGDTTYITVLRPLPGGGHRTMRIALHIDHETDAFGRVLPPSNGAVPSPPTQPPTESAAN